ncbi:MAG TPA: DNA-binding response regulator [Eubacterium sp.]|nr:response regulator transcription factor [Lachnospiraceae bacterium]HBZ52808.1 DNA-binding response regulator [Eubacterium sp.]
MASILIIEDELSIAELERDYLEIAGYEVTVASTGAQAMEFVSNKNYDLYIIDIMLPDMDGIDICRNIRRTTDRPIMMISAKDSEGDKIRSFNVGADDYMTKPFSPSEMVARVKVKIERYSALKLRQTVDYDTLQYKNIRLDLDHRRVYVDDTEKELTVMEYSLLAFLLEHKGVVYSKEELYNIVWKGDATEDSTTTVAVHIKKLREKIEKNPSKPTIIETIWGVGYRIGEA